MYLIMFLFKHPIMLKNKNVKWLINYDLRIYITEFFVLFTYYISKVKMYLIGLKRKKI